MNILAIDDIPDNLVTLKAILGAFLPEAHLKTSQSAADGINVARESQPDVILLDIQMPVMDGYEAARQLKNDIRTRHIPIILITAHSDGFECKIKGLEHGADSFLSKPIEEAELVAQIRAMYRIKKSEDSLRRERDNLEILVAERIQDVYEKQRLNQLLLDAIPHSTYLINREKKVISLNRMASDWGATVGNYCWCCIHKPLAIPPKEHEYFLEHGEPLPGTKCYFCLADEAMRSNKPVFSEIEHSGSYWDVWWIPVDDSLYLHYTVDVTARKNAEQEKLSLEKQLFHAQKLESIGMLAGGIAHDFNNILTVITGYATMLRRKLADENDKQAMVDEIIKSSERAEEMTKSLLMFSTKETLDLRPYNLNQIVMDLSKTLKRLIREDIAIKIEIGDDDLPVVVDKVQIEQVIINLVVNARDAIPADGLITLQTKLLSIHEKDLVNYGVDVPGSYVALSLSDTGLGMDIKTMAHIFEPFYTTKAHGKGTGLGLAISYSIVKKHNGGILVKSNLGQGTTFTVCLPVSKKPDRSQQILTPIEHSSGNETILLVEDENDVRSLIKLVLETAGYMVLDAEDGESGLSTFKDNESVIRLVISDVIMPRKNGVDMSRDIREINNTIPIILASGYTDGLMGNDIFTEDHTVVIKKPIKPDHLLISVRSCLDRDFS